MKTDAQVQHDVLAELKWEPSVDAALIGVTVQDGIVTLGGTVSSFTQKWDAERVAQRVAGVRGLAVDMDVKLPGSSKRIDTDIARSAGNALKWVNSLPKDTVSVMVEDGWITLSGEVDWQYQRESAAAAVRGLLGVIGVSDMVSIKHKPPHEHVKADIEAALKRRALAEIAGVQVVVQGGDVTLSGVVNTWSEREMVRQSAWSTAGVHTVTDLLTVGG
jgi:osmotically-inducible protein OsmY